MQQSSIKTAVILAAGRGSRLENITDDLPKCLVRVNGETLLKRMLSQLNELQIENVILVVGYKYDQIKNVIGSSYGDLKIDYVLNTDWATTNNVYSLYLTVDKISSNFLLLEADLIFEKHTLKPLMDSLNTMLVDRYQSFMDGTVVSLKPSGEVNQMFLKSSSIPSQDSMSLYKTVNVYSFDFKDFKNIIVPHLQALLDNGHLNVYYELAFGMAIQNNQIQFQSLNLESKTWAEIDDKSDLERAEALFSK